MPKTVYMVASGSAAEIFLNPDIRWTKECSGTVFVDRVLSDAMRDMFDGDVIYRCEPIDTADAGPATEPQPRTVKAYVAYDPGRDRNQDLWAAPTVECLRVLTDKPIFEIEMREVTPKRETGWCVRGQGGDLYCPGGYLGGFPVLLETCGAATELASALGHDATAVEVYRDTLEPVTPCERG